MRIGYYQYAPIHLSPKENLEYLESRLLKCTGDIMVLPELALSGYLFHDEAELHRCSQPPDGESARFFRDLSKRTGAAYVYGFAEAHGNRVFNSAAAVDKNGLIHLYRKLHLFDSEKKWFSPGNLPLEPFTCSGHQLGILICFDHFYPEAARTLALKGAQVICHPSNLVLPELAQMTTRVRSIENRVFWIMANRTGDEQELHFTGRSQIVGPGGNILMQSGETEEAEGTVRAEPSEAVDKHITRVNDLFADRVPSYYELDSKG